MAKVTPLLPESVTGCAGVLVPDGEGHRRVCFVQERAEHHTGRPFTERELRPSVDHFIPLSMGGLNEWSNLHIVHKYDQNVQGGSFGGRVAGKMNGWPKMSHEHHVKAGQAGAAALTPEQRSAAGRAAGLANVESGSLARARTFMTPEKWEAARQKGGKRAAEVNLASGQLMRVNVALTRERRSQGGKTTHDAEHRAKPSYSEGKKKAGRVSACSRFNIAKDKPCTCGTH